MIKLLKLALQIISGLWEIQDLVDHVLKYSMIMEINFLEGLQDQKMKMVIDS